MKIYVIWLIGVIAWNFGFPSMPPLADVFAAIVLSVVNVVLRRILYVNE